MEAWLLVVWCATCTPAQYHVVDPNQYVRLDAAWPPATRRRGFGAGIPAGPFNAWPSPIHSPCRVGTNPTASARPLRSNRGVRLAVGRQLAGIHQDRLKTRYGLRGVKEHYLGSKSYSLINAPRFRFPLGCRGDCHGAPSLASG
jgi:hypothetical protein